MVSRVFFLCGLMQLSSLFVTASEAEVSAVEQREKEVKQTILKLIDHATRFDVETLRSIYHDDLKIVKISDDGRVTTLDKKDILSFLEAKRRDKTPPLSKEVEFKYIDSDEDTAHVIIVRRMAMYGDLQESIYSIRLRRGSSGWLIATETVFVRNIPSP